jgi:transposase
VAVFDPHVERTGSGAAAGYLPPDPSSRTTYLAGEIAQCDFWFPPIRLPVGFGQTRTASQLPVLTMITGYAQWALALLLPTRQAEDLYAGWWRLQQLGAVPRVLVWDGEGAVGRWRARQPELTSACQGFRGVLGAKVLICKPADPEAKGDHRAAARLSGTVLSARPHLHLPDRLQHPTPGLAGNG